ncbi:type IV pilin protein [Peristeroidobacter agariperforans]|uniref:type IV pilin protein n=1 Tax=Peristeroidobacter agariperforans TaxID=268404 RepID=UPI00101CD7A7|nr:type IV pilin protein [Peristeroidobacter agariperforans]
MRTKTWVSAQRGITLIELLTVVAIVALLGTIAMSSYRSSVLRANRAEGTTTLLRVQAAQEKFYLNEQAYTNNLTQLGIPASTERGLYQIQVSNVTATGYTVTATAAGGQTGDTECSTLTIDSTGRRTPSPATTRCWR